MVDFSTNRKRAYDFLLAFNSNLGPLLPRFRAFVRRKPLFSTLPLFRPKFQGVPLGEVQDVGVCGERRIQAKLTKGEIIFEEFPPM